MEIKAILKLEKKYLKHCDYVLTNAKVLYWKKDLKTEKVDLTHEDNKDLVNRILLRNNISDINKAINHYLVERLRKANLEVKTYIKNYWNEIIEGFGYTKNKYSNQNSFHNTFLTNKDSALYRKFPDCLTAESMKNYIIYLRYYLNNLKSVGHKEAIEITKKHFAEDERIKAYYQEPALPDNWSEIYKQIQFLKSRERLLGVDSEDESDKEK